MGLLIFGIIIFVIIMLHEFGHLLAAKFYGVRVKTWSVGFGPRLVGIKFYKGKISWRFGKFMPTNSRVWFRKNNTEYRIAPIPLGGFCSMAGELKSTGKSYELSAKPFGQKVAIALAGVAINFITGLLALLGIGIKNYGFVEGIKNTVIILYQMIINLWVGLYLLCTNQIGITTASEVNQLMMGINFEYILICFGIFSILMAIINSLPYPCLDGSLPLLWILEKITKGKASKLLQLIWFIGFIILMVLQVIILYYWVRG